AREPAAERPSHRVHPSRHRPDPQLERARLRFSGQRHPGRARRGAATEHRQSRGLRDTMTDAPELAEARALVTGAGHGIGQSIAVELARRGAAVAVHTSSSMPRATLEAIGSAGGHGSAVQGDLSDPEVCSTVVAGAAAALGGLTTL